MPLIAEVDATYHEASPQSRYLSKDIRDLQVLQYRVLADNPLDEETQIPLGEIDPAEWRVVVFEHVAADGTRQVIERGVPLEELTTVPAEPSSVFADFEIDDRWQPGDPPPEYFDDSGFPIDPEIVAAALKARQSANDDGFTQSRSCLPGRIFERSSNRPRNARSNHVATLLFLSPRIIAGCGRPRNPSRQAGPA